MKVCVYGSTGLVGTVLVQELKKLDNIDIITPDGIEIIKTADVYFFCTPEKISKHYIKQLPNDVIIIDFSTAYRKESFDNRDWSYGQINNHHLRLTNKIAVAGCIASSIEIALQPLVVSMHDIFITSFIGQSAQGRSTELPQTEIKHVFNHAHNHEINKYLETKNLTFIPVVGEHKSGIMTICQIDINDDNCLYDNYKQYYEHNKDIIVLNEPHQLNNVIGTNNTIISIISSDNITSITCSIDNLYRGSATHGIQLMQEFLK